MDLEKLEALYKSGDLQGIFPGIDNTTYHLGPGHSCSGIKQAAKTLAHYRAYRLRPPQPDTASQAIGSGVHLCILEPDKIEENIVVVDGRRTKEDKAKAQEAEAAGKLVLNSKDFTKVVLMAKAISEHDLARSLFQGGDAEVSCYHKHESGLLLKCRPDYLGEDYITDIKYYNDLGQNELERQIYRMKYHWQSDFYLQIVSALKKKKINKFYHVFVEEPKDEYSYVGVKVVVLNDAALEKARYEYEPVLQRIAEAEEMGFWPGYDAEAVDASLPSWAW